MKKILWVCNVPLPEIQDAVGVKNYTEGWLIGISEQLRKREDIEFHYAFPQNRYKRNFHRMVNGISFWGFYNVQKKSYTIEKERIQNFNFLIKKINPDIIHIFGTEYPHSLECICSVKDKEKVVISLQGLISELAKVYTQGIPFIDCITGGIRGTQYRCILRERLEFYRRGVNEKKALLYTKNIIGRTAWDRECVKRINPKCRYYYCNETMRDTFYGESWDIEHIQRYSVFVSQGNYPIKGLHVLITALPYVKRRYPDVMVYVAGNRDFLKEDTPYGHFIKKLMKKNEVESNITFLGFLTGEKVKQRLLKSHVAVMPSLLENSPNSVGEAMLLGVPVIAANTGGIPTILQNDTGGYLYSCANKIDLARKICKIFTNDNLALRFSENGKKAAEILYDRSHNLDQLLAIYHEIGREHES